VQSAKGSAANQISDPISSCLESKNYAAANESAKLLVEYASDLSEGQRRGVIAGIDASDQIRGSFEVGGLIPARPPDRKTLLKLRL
jgi:hypothetical protein